jgi:hypothetical protein
VRSEKNICLQEQHKNNIILYIQINNIRIRVECRIRYKMLISQHVCRCRVGGGGFDGGRWLRLRCACSCSGSGKQQARQAEAEGKLILNVHV